MAKQWHQHTSLKSTEAGFAFLGLVLLVAALAVPLVCAVPLERVISEDQFAKGLAFIILGYAVMFCAAYAVWLRRLRRISTRLCVGISGTLAVLAIASLIYGARIV